MGAFGNLSKTCIWHYCSSVKEYVKGQVRTNLDKFLENPNTDGRYH